MPCISAAAEVEHAAIMPVPVQVPQDNPVQALKLAKQIAIAVYEGARKLGGDVSPVLVPPRCAFLVTCSIAIKSKGARL